MRRLPLREQIALSLLLTFILSCGGSTLLKSFRVALASSAPLINSLVASGAIPQGKATAIIADFDAGAQCGLTLQNEFNAAQTRADKFAAASKAETCFRAIVDRQNFAAHPRVQQAANIAQGILQSLVIFYSDTGDASDSAKKAADEKDLEKKIEARVEALKAALRP